MDRGLSGRMIQLYQRLLLPRNVVKSYLSKRVALIIHSK